VHRRTKSRVIRSVSTNSKRKARDSKEKKKPEEEREDYQRISSTGTRESDELSRMREYIGASNKHCPKESRKEAKRDCREERDGLSGDEVNDNSGVICFLQMNRLCLEQRGS